MIAPTAVVPPVPQRSSRPSRLRLVRDTVGAAFVLVGFVVVFANLLPVKADPQSSVLAVTGTPEFTPVIVTPQPADSPVAVAPATLAPTPTEAPVLVSSTPSPTPTATPTSAPTARPTARPTPPPTQAPVVTPPPTAKPKPTPKPTPRPTPRPAPVITSFTAPSNALPEVPITFGFSFAHGTSWVIAYDDGEQDSCNSGCGTSGSPTHSYAFPGSYTAALTVFGGGKSDAAWRTVNVP
jgi:hypothetical protein